MPEPEKKPAETPPCPKCGSTNTKQTDLYEDSYGALITEYECSDCKFDWIKQVGG